MADVISSPLPVRLATVNATLTTNSIDLIPSHYPPPAPFVYRSDGSPQSLMDYPKYDAPSPPTHALARPEAPPPLHPRAVRNLRPVSDNVLTYHSDLESDIPKNYEDIESDPPPPMLFPRCREASARGDSTSPSSVSSKSRLVGRLSLPFHDSKAERTRDFRLFVDTPASTEDSLLMGRRETSFDDWSPLIGPRSDIKRTINKSDTQPSNQLSDRFSDVAVRGCDVNPKSLPGIIHTGQIQPFNFLGVSKYGESGGVGSRRPVMSDESHARGVLEGSPQHLGTFRNQSPGGRHLMTSSKQPSAVAGQVVALDHWPLRTPTQTPKHNSNPEPETHFSLDRVVPKRHSTYNEYVDEPSVSAVRTNDTRRHAGG